MRRLFKQTLTISSILFLFSSCRLLTPDEGDRLPRSQDYSNLWSIGADGSNLNQLTGTDHYCYFAKYLPNGKLIIAVLSDSLGTDQTIYSLDPNNSQFTPIVKKYIMWENVTQRLLMTPDSKKLIFSDHPSDDLAKDIYCINLDGTGLTNLTGFDDTTGIRGMALSPDGQTILYDEVTYRHKGNRLRVMDLQGANKRTIKTFDTTITYYPQFSPDGQKIIFCQRANTTSYETPILSVNLNDTSIVEQLATSNLRVFPEPSCYFPQISPTGSMLIQLGGGILSLDTKTLSTQPMTKLLYKLPYYSDDGTKIVCSNGFTWDLNVVSADGTTTTALLSSTSGAVRGITLPRFSPSNDKIIFLARETVVK